MSANIGIRKDYKNGGIDKYGVMFLRKFYMFFAVVWVRGYHFK
jgi:hypothetical protein